MSKSSLVRTLWDTAGKFAFLRLGIRNKLVVLLLGFGLVPAFTMFSMLLMQADGIKALLDARVQSAAQQVNNVIDRNLSERYSDAQVFAMNVAAQDEWNWNKASDDNPLVQAMNSYMTSSGIYKLMLVLDPTGKAVAVNSVDPKGKPLATEKILNREFGNAPWFARAAKGEFLQGRNGLTGTSVEQPGQVDIVAELYGGNGYVIPFSAAVKDANGKTLAIWVNFADFGLVEQIVDDFYQGFAQGGMASAELTILDPQGRVTVDYDPSASGFTALAGHTRNASIVGQLNLVDKGVAAAAAAVKGGSGVVAGLHSRKQIELVAGYHHSVGAYDYPGLGWSALVRIPVGEAYASIDSLTWQMIVVLLMTTGATLALGAFVGAGFAKPIVRLTGAMKELAGGNNRVEIPNAKRGDEVGEMARTVEVFKQHALEIDQLATEKAEQERRAEQEKKAAMNALADDFEARIAGIVDTVSSQSTEMHATAQAMSTTAEETSRQATVVATASEQATANVQTVASAT
ncbi:MAG: HAMP domain-containing protein, partial [Alphaproteobacteria bacterium]